jgi:hypothetical protein
MRRSLLLALVLCLFIIPTAAQTDPAPLTAEDIFAPNVEIRYVTPDEPQPDFAADDELRIVAIGDRLFTYPDGIARVAVARADADSFLLDFKPAISSDVESAPTTWLYSVTDDNLAPFVPACSNAQPVSAEQVAAHPWVMVFAPDDTHLCNLVTGQRSKSFQDAFPNRASTRFRYLYGADAYNANPSVVTSPDGAYVLFFLGRQTLPRDDSQPQQPPFYELAGHIIAEDRFVRTSRYLFNSPGTLTIDQWFGSRFFVIVESQRNSAADQSLQTSRSIYSGDLLTVLDLHSIPDRAVFRPQPPRYETPDPDEISCVVQYYDVTLAQSFYSTRPDGLCRPEYGAIDGLGYYRGFPLGTFRWGANRDQDIQSTSLVRYDVEEQLQNVLYTGEIEQVHWVSENERYTILTLDNNGRIDNFPNTNAAADTAYGLTIEVLIDLRTDTPLAGVVKEQWAFSDDVTTSDWAVNHGIYSQPDGTFLKIVCRMGAHCGRDWNVLSRLTIVDDVAQEAFLTLNPVMLAPDGRRVFVWSQARDGQPSRAATQGVSIFDSATGQVEPFLRDLATSDYDFELRNDGSRTIVRLMPKRRDVPGGEFSVVFEPDGALHTSINLPTPPDIDRFACTITLETGANLRAQPNAESERVGTAEAGQRLLVAARENGWWGLAAGGYVSDSVVVASEGCNRDPLPTIDTVNTSVSVPSPVIPVEAATAAPAEAASCTLTVVVGANIRKEPSAESELTGSAAVDFVLTAVGQAENTQDFFTWWQLDTEEWIREDFVREGEGCDALPVIQP